MMLLLLLGGQPLSSWWTWWWCDLIIIAGTSRTAALPLISPHQQTGHTTNTPWSATLSQGSPTHTHTEHCCQSGRPLATRRSWCWSSVTCSENLIGHVEQDLFFFFSYLQETAATVGTRRVGKGDWKTKTCWGQLNHWWQTAASQVDDPEHNSMLFWLHSAPDVAWYVQDVAMNWRRSGADAAILARFISRTLALEL